MGGVAGPAQLDLDDSRRRQVSRRVDDDSGGFRLQLEACGSRSDESGNTYKEAYGPLIEDIYAEGNTVVVKTKGPEPLMPLWWPTYDNQVGYVLSKAQWEREGNEGYRTHPIGAGQFKLKERNTASRYVDLEAWEEHYCCVPTVKNVRVMEVPELFDPARSPEDR